MSSEVLKKFGRYFLLDHLAQGGMAEIFRARPASADGGGRIIVIKRIQAGFGANSEFLQMFKSEIKVSMGFNHPNIVQLYDYGEEQNQPYISMEWVDGRNLRQFITRFAEMKQPFPVELAAYIIEQAAAGLNYAHSFRDKATGEPLNIVHRDISPQNILISFEGNVKVIDFGIAKATTNMEATRAGVIKGKPSYLSPEQISGDPLDGRSDIFALGACLWEVLTGRKLFSGESDLAVLKQIESCQTHVKPPSTLNPKIPKELDFIVLKSLAKQRDNRYTAEELQRALHKFLYSYMAEFNPADLAYYAKDLFKMEIVEDRKRVQKMNERAEDLIESMDQNSSNESSDDSEDSTTILPSKHKSSAPKRVELTLDEETTKSTKVEMDVSPQSVIEKPRASQPQTQYAATPRSASGFTQTPRTTATSSRPRPVAETEKSGFGKIFSLIAALVLLLGLFGPEFGIEIPYLSTLFGDVVGRSDTSLVLNGKQKNVTVTVNGQTVADSLPATLNGIPIGTPFKLSVTGSNGTFQQEVTLRKGERKVLSVVLSSDENTGSSSTTASAASGSQSSNIPAGKNALLKLNIQPSSNSESIMLNGKILDPSNPSIVVPLDAPLELSVDLMGFQPLRREFVVSSAQVGSAKEWAMDVQMEPVQFGFLTLQTTPSAEATLVQGTNVWRKKTPVENEKLPLGVYTIKLSNELLGLEKTVTVTIPENKAVVVDERLEVKN